MGSKNATSVALLVCFLASFSFAGTTDLSPLKSETRQAIEVLQAEIPGTEVVIRNNKVSRLYGKTMSSGTNPQESAEQFIAQRSEALGIQQEELMPVGTLREGDYSIPMMHNRESGQPGFHLLSYTQHVQGIPVFGGEVRLLVQNQDDYPVVLASSTIKDTAAFVLPSTFSATDDTIQKAVNPDLANHAAANYNWHDFQGNEMISVDPGLDHFSEHELIIWAGLNEKHDPVLAVSFIADNDGNLDAARPERWRMVADISTGEILHIESMIHFTNIDGSVRGYATQGIKAWECQPETLQPMPFINVETNSGASAESDILGNFQIINPGSAMVQVNSPLEGRYFYVENYLGTTEDLSDYVTPPGPALFVHNEANDNAQIWSQTNAYVAANAIRNFVLSYSPSYPTISTQENFLISVNRTDLYCPGNAWYNGSSLNFCTAGPNNPNTAFASVLHHEYGHHVVEMGGSGQSEYGEGISDAVSFLYADDPGLGYGFYTDQCDTPLRNADNDCQYLASGCSTCGSESHACGKLLAGAIWSVRTELKQTNPFDYIDILAPLVINSVPLHGYSSSIGQDIVVDFLTLDDNDGDIYNGTPHGAEICAGFQAHALGDICDQIVFAPLAITYPNGRPDMITPDQPTSFVIEVEGLSDTPNYRSLQVRYSLDGGSWANASMTDLGDGLFEVHLPAISCGTVMEWYSQCDSNSGTTVFSPSGAPTDVYAPIVASGITVFFEDDFESDSGWTTSGDATEGGWERGVPVNNGRGDPATDYDGSGKCFLTENDPYDDNSDIDGGYVYLNSPAIDLAGTDAEIKFALWYTNNYGDSPESDTFKIYVSNNGGSDWVLIETVGPETPSGWNMHSFFVSDYVTPTSNVKVRFEGSDLGNGSVVEAAIDAFDVSVMECDSNDSGDLDNDGDVDFEDFALFQICLPMTSSCSVDADLNNDGSVSLGDFAILVESLEGPSD